MPLIVRRFYSSFLLVFIAFVLVSPAQTPAPSPAAPSQTPAVSQPQAPVETAGDLMRQRIVKAKAFIAVRNFSAAIYELENIKRESGDPAIRSGVNVLLMNSYLEQADYTRAQALLKQVYAEQKTTKEGAAANYLAVAGQIVKSARSRNDRYRSLGLNPGDRTLPLEALNDLEKMRETLEIVIGESKEMGADAGKNADAMALLEEATNSRSSLARDDYDARRWKEMVADTREDIANSQSVVLSAIAGTPEVVKQASVPPANIVAAAGSPTPPPTAVSSPVPAPGTSAAPGSKPAGRPREVASPPQSQAQPDNTAVAKADTPAPVYVLKPVEKAPETLPKPAQSQSAKTEKETKTQTPEPTPLKSPDAASGGDNSAVLSVGSLIDFATKQTSPPYPAAARAMHMSGVVRVDVLVDEAGDVVSVEKVEGPSLLQGAAKDAVRRWKFKPFLRDGQPVKASGFVNFNFNL